ncbi:hypothetical protein [Pseudomonas mucidolens]|uniref:Uncharacterized protein n=1 Tax=Pseudomonas mucidolens TaxID=46679 RepID=A0A1H2P0B3_9PSED|nr:hypothetical protein [Pseudomonas mucidolens]SDV11103.1 hypothetical protein SAMN05216202_5182 [Pseudomonas mucidolens]SQH36758.1 Uncharacterised protein [Pseudomonas mucidolens]
MNHIKSFLTAVSFSIAGAAAHANAAIEQSSGGSATCFQLTPVSGKDTHALLATDGSSRTAQEQPVHDQTA